MKNSTSTILVILKPKSWDHIWIQVTYNDDDEKMIVTIEESQGEEG